ncbi:MAG: hypothetical protein H6656_21220 [Ardenticatenaceae bacterium]|nr:hypothetical protein [Ardenticatenaceae bacterium]
MAHKSVYAKMMLVLLVATVVLAACTITNNPTPAAPLAEVVTVSVERPSATATPSPSSTPTATRILVETAVPTSTPPPTTTPTATAMATPFLAISPPILSSQGQLAFIKNQTLFVETAVGSEIFNTLEDYIAAALWSPQGDRLLFATCAIPGQIVICEGINWFLYQLEGGKLINLADLFNDLPVEDLGVPTWLNSGEKLLVSSYLQGDILVLDLKTGTFSVPIRVFNELKTWELPGENLLIQDHFGTWLNELHTFTLDGEKLWSLPNFHPEGIDGGNAAVLGFSEVGQLLIILEPVDNLNEFATFYHFDPVTFETERLLSVQLANFSPDISVSPNGQFVAYFAPGENAQNEGNVLTIVDQNGRSYGQRPNSVIIDWRPDGGPVVKEIIEAEQTQLVYWPLDGAAAQVFVSPTSLVFGGGKWSGDGRFFIYSAVNEAENQSHLYLWRPESGAPILLHTAAGTDGFRNFAWLPDSTAVYFNLGQTELWNFEVETESLTLIASSAEN